MFFVFFPPSTVKNYSGFPLVMSVRVNIQAIAARIGSNTLVTLSRTKWQLREEENGANGIWLLVRCINTVCDGAQL